LRVRARVQDGFARGVLVIILKTVSLFSKLEFSLLKRKVSRVDYFDRDVIIGCNNLSKTRMMRRRDVLLRVDD
jgi:hypothetical protein